MPRPLKVGFILPHLEGRTTPRWDDIVGMARLGEEMGFDSLWLVDHLLYQFGADDQVRGVWECWTLLGGIAAVTTKPELGTLVTCTAFRSPALLAKMAETIDEMSAGRLILGIGAGYYEREFKAFGLPHDHLYGRFEEALHILTTLLRTGSMDYDGTYASAIQSELRPRGPRPEGLPIMIGTRGAKMLKLTAQHADAWNGWLVRSGNSMDAYLAVKAEVDAACEAVGRDPKTLERTVTVNVDPRPGSVSKPGGPICGTPDEIAAQLAAYAAEGVTHLQLASRAVTPAEMEPFADILAALDRLG